MNPDWAVRPLAISERGAPITFVLENSGGETLDGYPEAMEIKQFLGLAVGFTTTLEALHEKEMIHKCVKPTNVLAHSSTDRARLMYFGIASRDRREHPTPETQGSSPKQCVTWLLNELGERIARSTREAT